jgi:hypothetical protein
MRPSTPKIHPKVLAFYVMSACLSLLIPGGLAALASAFFWHTSFLEVFGGIALFYSIYLTCVAIFKLAKHDISRC